MRLLPESEISLRNVTKLVEKTASKPPHVKMYGSDAKIKCPHCGGIKNVHASAENEGHSWNTHCRTCHEEYVIDHGGTSTPFASERPLVASESKRIEKNAGTERTFSQIRAEEDPDGKGHDLHMTCTRCHDSQTCRCSKPKREFHGICDKCSKMASGQVIELSGEICECPACGKRSQAKSSALSGHGIRCHSCPHCGEEFFVHGDESTPGGGHDIGRVASSSVFVLEDDQERIDIFKAAYGQGNIVTTKSVKAALDLLRTRKFAKVFLDRDLSSNTETGEDVAWHMEREGLCKTTPVVIHSENTRGQRVMAKYLGKYHHNVTVMPFRELRKHLEIPGGVRI